MNITRHRGILIILCGLAVLQLAGCTSSEEFYEDVSLSRETAYREWQNRKENEQAAEPLISGQLNLQDCFKLALANNKVLQRILQEKDVARGGELKSYSAAMPSVGLTGQYTRLDLVQSIEIPTSTGNRTITLGDLNNYSVGLRVTQPIYAGGAIIAQINAGKLFSLITDQTVRAAVQEVVYLAAYSYYTTLLNQHLSQISTDAVRSSQAHLNDVKQKRQIGVASDFDVLRSEVELSNFQAELIKNKNAIDVEKTNLLKIMGVSQDSNVALSDEMAYTPFKMEMENAVEVAYRNRPDLFSREFDIKYQKELLRIAYSQYFPVVSGFYDNLWSKPDPHTSTIIEWGHSWQTGVMVTLPLFDGLSREGEILTQKARLKQSQIDLINTEETALFELTKGLLNIRDAEEFVESQKLNLTRAQEGLRLAEVGYREGINTQVEILDAQSALTTAGANHYQAIYSHIIAKLYLQKAMGTLTGLETPASAASGNQHELQTAKEMVSSVSVE